MLAGILCGCGLIERQIVVLSTNLPEFAAYVEVYNSSSRKYRVELAYEAVPQDIPASAGSVSDVVVSEGLAAQHVIDGFEALDDLLTDGGIDGAQFYQDLLDVGRLEQETRVLPVAFNLPAVVFSPNLTAEMVNVSLIALDGLRELSAAFNRSEGHSLVSEGFSPLWNEDFFYYTCVLFGARFRAAEDSILVWDDSALVASVEYIRGWIEDVNGGVARDTAFSAKYFTVPMYKLVADGRVRFWLSTSERLFAVSQEIREELDFCWLSHERRIPVEDNIVWAGVPASAGNKRGARDFLSWLFGLETQRKILQIGLEKRLRVFGVADGFSSVREVNERELPQRYPALVGKVPEASLLVFPERLPAVWDRVRKEALEQEFFRSVVVDRNASFASVLESWIRRNVE